MRLVRTRISIFNPFLEINFASWPLPLRLQTYRNEWVRQRPLDRPVLPINGNSANSTHFYRLPYTTQMGSAGVAENVCVCVCKVAQQFPTGQQQTNAFALQSVKRFEGSGIG